jgi:hypothetical protein
MLRWVEVLPRGGEVFGVFWSGGVGFLAAKFPRLLSSDLIFLRFPFCFFQCAHRKVGAPHRQHPILSHEWLPPPFYPLASLPLFSLLRAHCFCSS